MTWMVLWLMALGGCAGDVVEGSVPDGPEPVPVETWSVSPQALSLSASWTGLVRGVQQATVLTETAGRVTQRVAGLGDRVPAGAVLVRLEDGRQTIGVQAAQATLARAQAGEQAAARQLARAQALGDALAQADGEDAATALELARADRQAAAVQLQARERDLADTRVRAPFAGDVTQVHVELGQVVSAGTPVATVVNTRELRVRIRLSPQDLEGLTDDTQAWVHGHPCWLAGVDRQADPATGLVQVEVACEPDPAWVIGAPAPVRLSLGDPGPTLAVPPSAVLERYGEHRVFVVVDGLAYARSVQLGQRTDDWHQVLAGLSEGERVVVRGAERLTEGAPVRPL